MCEHLAHVGRPDRHRDARAGLVPAEAPRPVVADPDAGHDVRREPDEPCVRVVVAGARLGGDGPAEHVRALAGAALDDALEHVRDHVGHRGRHRLRALGHALEEELALSVGDVADRRRLHPHPLVCERAVGGGQLEEGQVRGPEGQRQVGVERARDAHPPRDADGAVDADPLLELDGDHVDRFLDRLLERGRAAKLPVVVVGLPRFPVPAEGIGDGRVVDDRRRREARLDRRHIYERLERRTRLAPRRHRTVELAAEEIEAAHHGLDVAGLRIDREDRPLRVIGAGPARARLDRPEPVPERLLGHELHRGAEARVGVEPALEDHVGTEPRLERLLDVVEEILAARAAPLGGEQPEVRRGDPLGVRRLQESRVHHSVQHDFPSSLGRRGMVERGVGGRRARQPRQQRRLAQLQIRDRLAEVGARRRLDPVGALAEVDLVQVHLEDAILGVPTLQLEREHGLLQLALEALVRGEEEHLRELLRDRAAALGEPSAPVVLVERAQDTDRVQAEVGVEALVLGRDQRVAQRARDRRQRHEDAPLDLVLADRLVVLVEDLRALERLDRLERGDRRQRPVQDREGPQHRRGAGGDHDEEGEADDQGKPPEPAATWRFCFWHTLSIILPRM